MSLPHAKKSLGQHWLTDPTCLGVIVDAANVSSGDVVLEIGPGTGTLTDVLLSKGASVIALEFDHERSVDLRSKYQHLDTKQIIVEEGDIRSYDLSGLPINYKIVANIPYYLTANLLRKLQDDNNKPEVASLLVQKEVAERICEKPGKLSLVTVLTQIFYEVSVGEVVPAHMFTPPPKVDSQVLILQRRPQPLIPVTSQTIEVIKAGFSQPRKKLRTSFSGGLGVSKSTADKLITRAGISIHARAQELTFTDWQQLIAVVVNT